MDRTKLQQIKLQRIKRTWGAGNMLYPSDIDFLLTLIDELQHEYICKTCGLRQNSQHETPNF